MEINFIVFYKKTLYISSDDEKILEINERELDDNKSLRLMVERLRNAAADEEMLNQVEILEEVEGMIEDHIREKQELAEKNAGLTEMDVYPWLAENQ